MNKINLDGLTSKTHSITIGDDPQLAVLQNVSVSAKIKAEIKRETAGADAKLFPNMKVLTILEAQNKIEALSQKRAIKNFRLATVKDSLDVDITVVKEAALDLAYGGEIKLGQNDSVDLLLQTLNKTADSNLFVFEGKNSSPFPYVITEQTFKSDKADKKVDLTQGQFVIFDIDNIPSEVELRINNEKIIRTPETLLMQENDAFGVIGHDVDNAPIYGSKSCVVIDARLATSLDLEDFSEPRKDIKFYLVNTPFTV